MLKLKAMKKRLIEFLNSNPSEEETEVYYINNILPHTKDSINDILNY